ncbi:hypothetical protein NOF04DRAFT_9747 [Fusarium oxysporum II5]|uniref:WSC domain-containing protein n=2 Tax=Fusarium oxysporum species complex TaxID=171631 RepID=X0J5P1_FUSO5|nr:uncharacterized protein FOIG_11409 [Fusarium odoratissimum NRRL 54006]EXL96457.1 hypothetical protein FOIG_11409 [Fusarium odoratissimum NRRL 54006]KAK2125634.1 hypothetical protein NOF04DRAFT_9747 [Fusarium oxysporum II5]TXC00051.1 hypothetical protein FocTR4_00013809 [Fusarium oxysporum f. sp. cubense]
MKISFVPLAFVAALAGFGEARNCTPKLDHCGHFLLDIGKYYSTISDELTRATKATCFKKSQINDALFSCGPNGTIKFKKYCKNGCQVGAMGKHDYCWT